MSVGMDIIYDTLDFISGRKQEEKPLIPKNIGVEDLDMGAELHATNETSHREIDRTEVTA